MPIGEHVIKRLTRRQVADNTRRASTMEATLDQLQTSLQDVSSGVFNGREPDLFHAIEALRPQLVRLLHFGDKSQVERTALKDG